MRSTRSGDMKNIGLASLGAALEYYDFIVYVYVSVALSQAFFSAASSAWVREIQVLSIYAVGYLVRPVAGIVIAHLADRFGRKRMFVFTVLLMSVPTFLMGVLPTFDQVGWLAPVLLLLMRVAQGCAVGGELPGAAVFVSEHARPERLFLSSGSMHGIVISGLLLGAGAATLASVVAALDPSLSQLAWRLPFLLGGISGLIAAYLRRHLEETPQFTAIREQRNMSRQVPVAAVIKVHWRACLLALGLGLQQTMVAAVFFQYMPNYLIANEHLPRTSVSSANLLGILAFCLSMPLWGALADRLGTRWTITASAVASLLAGYWFFSHLPVQSTSDLLFLFVPPSLAGAGITAIVPGLVASMFPTQIRQSGYALPYNVGAAVYAGPALLVLAAVVRGYGTWAALAVYAAACVLALVTSVALRSQPRFLGAENAVSGGAAGLVPLPARTPTA